MQTDVSPGERFNPIKPTTTTPTKTPMTTTATTPTKATMPDYDDNDDWNAANLLKGGERDEKSRPRERPDERKRECLKMTLV